MWAVKPSHAALAAPLSGDRCGATSFACKGSGGRAAPQRTIGRILKFAARGVWARKPEREGPLYGLDVVRGVTCMEFSVVYAGRPLEFCGSGEVCNNSFNGVSIRKSTALARLKLVSRLYNVVDDSMRDIAGRQNACSNTSKIGSDAKCFKGEALLARGACPMACVGRKATGVQTEPDGFEVGDDLSNGNWTRVPMSLNG